MYTILTGYNFKTMLQKRNSSKTNTNPAFMFKPSSKDLSFSFCVFFDLKRWANVKV